MRKIHLLVLGLLLSILCTILIGQDDNQDPYRWGEICGRVYNDTSGDGFWQSNEFGVANVQIQIQYPLGTTLHSFESDFLGNFDFYFSAEPDLNLGAYPMLYINVVPPAGWIQTSNDGLPYDLEPEDWYACTVYFGIFNTVIPQAPVQGVVIEDVDLDEVADVDEPGIPGVQINLLEPVQNRPVAATFTDDEGGYSFEVIPRNPLNCADLSPSGDPFDLCYIAVITELSLCCNLWLDPYCQGPYEECLAEQQRSGTVDFNTMVSSGAERTDYDELLVSQLVPVDMTQVLPWDPSYYTWTGQPLVADFLNQPLPTSGACCLGGLFSNCVDTYDNECWWLQGDFLGFGILCDNSDIDGDGHPATCDNCPSVNNPEQTDADDDGFGDECDNCPYLSNYQDDADGDGFGDACDNCPYVPNFAQFDMDNDGRGDDCDNCQYVPNNDQQDVDEDGIGDVCDPDKDGDGFLNEVDNCPYIPNPGQEDHDNDGVGNACDETPCYNQCSLDEEGYCSGNALMVCDEDNWGCRSWVVGTDCEASSQSCVSGAPPYPMCDSVCGDGLVANSEECDDNNQNNGDGCSEYCLEETGACCVGLQACMEITEADCSELSGYFLGTGSTCNQDDEDNDFIPATCDNCPGIYNPDQLDLDGNGVGDACECGNNNVDIGEACDDGNLENGDGCSDECQTETGACCYPTGETDGSLYCTEMTNGACQLSFGEFFGYNSVCDNGDTDNDGALNTCDNCADVNNPNQEDGDFDGAGDVCDNCPLMENPDQTDADEDGRGDVCDNCPSTPNQDQQDTDEDGWGDVCDNCPQVSNPDQFDDDFDGIGNACDCGNGQVDPGEACDDGNLDNGDGCSENCLWESGACCAPAFGTTYCSVTTESFCSSINGDFHGYNTVCDQNNNDEDSIVNTCDNCPDVQNQEQEDLDGDGVGDACDPDLDGDGYPNEADNCPHVDNLDQYDTDEDGWGDACDNCVTMPNPGQEDSNGNGIGDDCDWLSDECAEGQTTCVETVLYNCEWYDPGQYWYWVEQVNCADFNQSCVNQFGAECMVVCGDGMTAEPETCDDGNLLPGDGCSAACTLEGDINGDGALNVVDIVQMVGLILENAPYLPQNDPNLDGMINVVDIVLLVCWITDCNN